MSRSKPQPRRGRATLGCLVSAVAVTGCTVGPDYARPAMSPPAAFEGLTPRGPKAPLGGVFDERADVAAWWTSFHDPVLDRLVARAMAGNLDLGAAASRIRQARAQEGVARAGSLPQVSAIGNAMRVNRSASASNPLASLGGGGAPAGVSGGISQIDYFNAGFDASWEIDLFGGVRRSLEEARAATAAQVWRTRDTEVSLAAEVADTYLQYRLAQARLVVLHADDARRQSVLGLVGDRFSTGFVTTVDVNQQRNQLASTQSQIPEVEAQTQTALDALGVLLGETPEALSAEFAGAAPAAAPPAPPALPVGLPSDLLERRPDVRAAERALAAASAEIGVRTASLYPKLDLLALGAFGAPDVTQLFRGSNAIGAGLGMVQWPLITGGRTRADIRASREAYVQAEFAYRKTVLSAFRDVEDALARYLAEQRRWRALQGAFAAAQNSYLVATQQYAVGLADYTRVYDAQGALLAEQDQLSQSDFQLARDVASIYKALGGGWRLRD